MLEDDLKNVSVITITKIEKDFNKLLKTLESFCKTVSKENYREYIVVYSGIENLPELIPQDFFKNINNLRFIYSYISNWSVKRNIGLKNAIGNFVLFIDDGMEFANGWFDGLLDVFRRFESAAVACGVVLPLEDSKTILGKAQGILNHPGGGYRLIKEDIYEIEYFHTGICLARKYFLGEVMFDEDLLYGCEDMDISVRIKKKFRDVKFFLNPKALSFHHTRDSIKEIWGWMVRYGKGRVDIYYKHGLKMAGFFIHKLMLFVSFTCILSFFSPFVSLVLFLVFYLFYFTKLSSKVSVYKNLNLENPPDLDLKIKLALPFVFWIMNIAFDFGRISRTLSIWTNSFKKSFGAF